MADNAAAPSGESGQDQSQQPSPENLIEAAAKATPAPKQEPVAPAGDPAANTEWFWSEGVKGADKPPEWFDGKKYKTVAEQAKAYPELFKKFGEVSSKLKGFTGAPEKYDLTVPEALKDQIEWSSDDPLLSEFQKIANEAGMSQPVFEKLLHMFAQYEYTSMAPDWAKEKGKLGERADERLSGFWDWAGANLDEETATSVKRALGIAPSPADVFHALEAVQNAGRQPAIHKVGDDVRATMTQADWNAKWYAKSDSKGVQYKIDEPGNREKARGELQQIVGTGDHKVVMGKKAS